MSKPLVSICCITFNHELFIAEAIESFLMQVTDFDFEIVVGEDCSIDNTGEIVENYALKYPNKIRLLNNSVNLGLQKNFHRTLKACKGDFIAYCEGDDYWIDPYKLQKQTDILINNSDIVFCFSNALIKNNNTDTETFVIKKNHKIKKKFNLDDYIGNYHAIPMLTTFFRAKCIQKLPVFLESIIQLDYAFRFIIGSQGDFAYLPEATAVYRKHDGGITNNSTSFLLSMLKVNKELNIYFDYKYERFFGTYPTKTYEKLCYTYAEKKYFTKVIRYFFKSLFISKYKLRPFKDLTSFIKHLFKLFISK